MLTVILRIVRLVALAVSAKIKCDHSIVSRQIGHDTRIYPLPDVAGEAMKENDGVACSLIEVPDAPSDVKN